jgi:hypothetical protein
MVQAVPRGLTNPRGSAVDTIGKVYAADSVNDIIRVITPAGGVSTLAGLAGVSGSADGAASASHFFGPVRIKVDDSGNVYVADTVNDTIRKITLAGVVTTLGGVPITSGSADGAGANARFASPQGVALNSENKIFISDTGNNTIPIGGISISTIKHFDSSPRGNRTEVGSGFIITGQDAKNGDCARDRNPSLEQAGAHRCACRPGS